MSSQKYTSALALRWRLGLVRGSYARDLIERHLAEGCAECERAIAHAVEIEALFANSVEIIAPSSFARARLIRAIRKSSRED